MAGAVAQPRDGVDLELALEPQHAEHQGARRLVAHQESRRGLAPKRVIDDARDGGAIARAGEAVRQAPVLERIGRGPALRLDLGEHLDGCGKAGAGGHMPTRMSSMKLPHMMASTIAPRMKAGPRRRTLLSVTATAAWITRRSTNSQASATKMVPACG